MTSRVALAVLREALCDLVKPLYKRKGKKGNASDEKTELAIIQDAKEFFFLEERQPDLQAWCDLAGVNSDFIKKRAKHVLEQQIDVVKEAEAAEQRRLTALLLEEVH